MMPFEAVYGRPPPTIRSYEVGSTAVAQVETTLLERDDLLRLLKENLQTAQNRMKINADRHRHEVMFETGDFVFLRLQMF